MRSDAVLVLGGGIVGLACAEEIARRGGDVVVFERRAPGGEASWAAGGMLALDYEFETPGPLRTFAEVSRRLWDGWAERTGAVAAWGDHVRPRPHGTLVPAASEDLLAALTARFEQSISSGRPIEILDGAAARAREPALGRVAGALWLRDDSAVNNRAVLLALVSSLRDRRVPVISDGDAAVWLESGSVRGVTAAGKRYPGAHVILAAGAWSSRVAAASGLAVGPAVTPMKGQMLGFQAESSDALRHVVRWEGGYAVPRGGGRIVVGTTSEPTFAKEVTAEGIARILSGFRGAVPGLAGLAHVHAWAGLRPGTSDGLPLLGAHRALPGLLFATGHFRNGVLLAPATASAIADLVEGKTPRFALEAFAPDREVRTAPAEIAVNGGVRPFTPGTTVGALLSELQARRPGVAVAVNGEVVRRSEWDTKALSDRDRVEIIHAVGGG